jgi:hypothetical protein
MSKSSKVKRGSDEGLFSVNAASEILGRTRRTVTRALQGVKPDANRSGLKLWSMRKIVDAVNRNTQAPILTSSPRSEFAAEFETDFKAFDAGFAKLEAEPDLERRRALNEKLGVGKMIGALDRLMKEQNAAMGEVDSCVSFVCDHTVGGMISNFLTLLDYWPDDAEMEKLRLEGKARAAQHA